MILAIDFDETYTRDPALWDLLLSAAMARGHRVLCVSARHERQMGEVRDTIGRLIGPDACFGTGGVPKRRHMAEAADTHVDVWIDDAPESVVEAPDPGRPRSQAERARQTGEGDETDTELFFAMSA